MLHIMNENYLYEMSNLNRRITRQPFDIWIDDICKDRKVGHNEARFKVEANNVQLDIRLHNNGKAELVNDNSRIIQKFKYVKEAIDFLERFSKIFLMQFNREIDTFQLADIIKLVDRKHYALEDAIEEVLSEDNEDE